MDKEYWTSYYNNHKQPDAPSSFAIFVLDYMEKEQTLLELGCGNARDAIFFNKNGVDVTAIDQVNSEIQFLQDNYGSSHLRFIADDFTNIQEVDSKFDYIYSRFTMHSITYEQEERTLNWIKNHLNKDGQLFIELRSVKDNLYKEGDFVNQKEHAKITDHYRRFTEIDRFKKDLQKCGFDIVFDIESKGLAVYKNDDPVVIRIVARNN